MRQVTCLVVLAMLWGGCSTHRKNMKHRLDSWVGSDIDKLVSSWGPPSAVYRNGGTTIYSWNSSGPAYVVRGVYGRVSTVQQSQCSIWFDVREDQTIAGWHYSGRC